MAIASIARPSRIVAALFLSLLWLDLFSLPLSPIVPELEASWCGALIHFSAQGLQFGKDVVFTYGPFAHLISFVYTGELFSARVAWELISKTLFVFILGGTLVRLPVIWRLLSFFFILFFVWADGISDSLFFLIISCLALLLFKKESSNAPLNILAGILLAIFSLIKFTYFLLVILVLVLALAGYFWQRKLSRAIVLTLTFLIAFFLCWGIAGQSWRNLPSYFSTSIDISVGYKEAMSLPASTISIVAAGAIALGLTIIQCALAAISTRQPASSISAAFVALETFLSWNRAFIRADDHVLSFFCLCPVIAILMWTVVEPGPTLRRVGYAINLLLFVVCTFAIYQQKPATLTGALRETKERIQRSWHVVSSLPRFSKHLDKLLAEVRQAHALPHVRSEVGKASVDVLGYEQAIALLNDFHYTPRPVFQGYSAYTARLFDLNTAFYQSDNAPDYVLFKYQSIDNRYPTLDDAGVLRQLLFRYKPMLQERGYLLWKKIHHAKPTPELAASTISLGFDSEYSIPVDKPLWLQLELKQSLPGHAISMLYRPPIVALAVTDTLGRRNKYRLIPSMSATGFIINPYLRTSRDILRYTAGLHPPRIKSFSVHVPNDARNFFQPNMTCHLVALPPIPQGEFDEQARQLAAMIPSDPQEAPPDWLEQAFIASKEILLSSETTNTLAETSPLNQAQLTLEGKTLRITATGTDPQILLPPFSHGNRGGVLVRIDIAAPTDTGFQVFYLPTGVSDYREHVLNRSLHHGRNIVYFFLSDSQLAGGPVRIDPGMAPGDYVITKIEVRAVSPQSLLDLDG